SPPSPKTKVVKLEFINSFDQSRGEALLEIPEKLNRPVPLIISPNPGNWTPEMNRSIWAGVADQFGVMILYPLHQGKLNPHVSFGSARQLGNLDSALAEVRRRYPVDDSRLYAAGLSQGAIESLLLLGRHPQRFAGALVINPIADYLAFHQGGPEPKEDFVAQFRLKQWTQLRKLFELDFGGTPDTARAEYYLRSPVLYAQQLAQTPLILYWAENDEIIGRGATQQGGMLAEVIRAFKPATFREVRHSGGHGYPFYRVNLEKLSVSLFPREIFLESVKEMLKFQRTVLEKTHPKE
ncbi:MAG: alpha/beta hydrolase family protein, partial [Blastocatellia bacterium]